MRNFYVTIINPLDHVNDIYKIYCKAIHSYNSFYEQQLTYNEYKKYLYSINKSCVTIGAWYHENQTLAGFVLLTEQPEYVDFRGCKADPDYEKYGCNAALVAFICNRYQERKEKGNFAICDGQKNILHETKFQEYLEKYFEFRKAYCKLNIIYKKYVKFIIYCLWPIRSLIHMLRHRSIWGKIDSMLEIESILREQEKNNVNNTFETDKTKTI